MKYESLATKYHSIEGTTMPTAFWMVYFFQKRIKQQKHKQSSCKEKGEKNSVNGCVLDQQVDRGNEQILFFQMTIRQLMGIT